MMQKGNLFFVLIVFRLPAACNHVKKTTTSVIVPAALAGTWELNYMTGPHIAFDGLYPNKKPATTFDVVANRVNGTTSCNNFAGTINAAGNKISFTDPMAVTRMA